ncbi:MAG: hypothetical protein JXA04_00800 [Gammaproteobacteria bacterium]|nr:hypothetical protein [Gammaproteobacteria bacterium]
MKPSLTDIFRIDPASRLSNLRIFKLVITLFLSSAFASTIIIICNSNLVFDFGFDGFNFGLFTVFRVPLAIIAAMLPILGLIAAVHRSSQTSLQIQKASEQNTFSNYYKHRQEYIDHFNEIKNVFPMHIKNELNDKNVRIFYSLTYPANSPRWFSIEHRLGWIDGIDRALIRLSIIIENMPQCENISILSCLYREFLRSEVSIRQGLFKISTPDEVWPNLVGEKIIKIVYWDGSNFDLKVWNHGAAPLVARITDYADLITHIKSAANSFMGTMLFGSSVYSSLSLLKISSPGGTLHTRYCTGILKSIYETNDPIEVSEEDNRFFISKMSDIENRYQNEVERIER